jgi:hypothetical protein
MCEHLAKYKVETFGVKVEDGIFTYRGKDIAKAHILPIRNRDLNILPEYRERFFASEYSNIKFHQFFHHLNSSQAMCINLFYPLIAEDVLGLVTHFLGIETANDLKPCFEKESEIEQAIRRTNFDFYIRCSAVNDIFFEVKYTENGFAKAEDDNEHKDKFRKTYRPLIDRSKFLSEECRDEKFFLDHYQILRNLVHLTATSYVILLFPSANSTVKREALEAYENFLTDAGKTRVKVVFLEDMVSFLEAKCSIGSLVNYYAMFRMKYLPS